MLTPKGMLNSAPSVQRCAGGSSPCSAPGLVTVSMTLFPGSAAVSRSWAAYIGQEPPFASAVYVSCKARADASSTAASDGSYPSREAPA